MFTDLYLMFNDEAEAKSILYDGDHPLYRNMDFLGALYYPLSEGASDPLPYPSPNYSVNVRLTPGENPEPLKPFVTQLSIFPQRVWA